VITLKNPTSVNLAVTEVKFNARDAFSYVPVSTSGLTTLEPTILLDDGTGWTLFTWKRSFPPLVTLAANGGEATLNFQAEGTLLPGTYASRAEVTASGRKASTGDVAPIDSIRLYTIVVEHNGAMTTVKAKVTDGGQIEIVSWEES
jgi:hypothetical protein